MSRTKQALMAATVACLAGIPGTGHAALEVDKVAAIDAGLAWLATQQQAGGNWNYGGYDDAATAAAISAFVSQKSLWGSNAVAYQSAVDKGMAFLLSNAAVNTVGVRSDGLNPCGTGTCTGVYWPGSGEATYTTGLVASAIGQYAVSNPSAVATTAGPLAGMTWTQIAQGITNEFAAGQTTAASGNLRGGWRYFPASGDSDGSTTQWAVLSMIYDQSLGATTPGFVKTELKHWLTANQAASGAGCYQPGSFCDHADTGSLLIGHAFVGDGKGNGEVDAALAWLNTNWKESANGTWFGQFGQPYALWADYKALELLLGLGDTSTITNLLSTCGAPSNLPGNPPGAAACNWWEDMNEWLVNNQNANGSWTGYEYWTGVLASSWYVSILGGTILPPQPTPEPASLLVLSGGLAGLGLLRRRRQAAA